MYGVVTVDLGIPIGLAREARIIRGRRDAAVHVNHGPAAAALFVFAVGLGWTYQRTHRIIPCVIAHLLLNACSLALLFLETGLDSGP